MQPITRPQAIITGASSGIGAHFATTLAKKGFSITIISRSKARLERIASDIRKRGGKVMTLEADLSTAKGVQKVQEHLQETKNLAMLINNAGFGMGDELLKQDDNYTKNMLALHNDATTILSKTALALMKEAGRGSIINVSSVASYFPLPNSATYSASKSYIRLFSEALSIEAKKYGVKVQALCPGYTKTAFFDNNQKGGKASKPVKGAKAMSAQAVVDASLKALRKNRVICIPGNYNKLLVRLSAMLPRRILRKAVESMSKGDTVN